jgi:hypothetical protein
METPGQVTVCHSQTPSAELKVPPPTESTRRRPSSRDGSSLAEICLCRACLCHEIINKSRGPATAQAVTAEAEVVVSAVGRPGFLRGEMLRKGCTVVDVGAPLTEICLWHSRGALVHYFMIRTEAVTEIPLRFSSFHLLGLGLCHAGACHEIVLTGRVVGLHAGLTTVEDADAPGEPGVSILEPAHIA